MEQTTKRPTLHRVYVRETARPFIQNQATNYAIVVGAEGRRAAEFLRERLQEATGVRFSILTDAGKWSPEKKLIVLGEDSLFKRVAFQIPEEELGISGYYIRTAGNSVFLMANGAIGYQNGVIAFLRQTLGYAMYALDTVEYTKSGATLPEMEITERPDFELRIQSNQSTPEADYGMGMQRLEDVFIAVEGDVFHNAFCYLPPQKFNDAEKPNYCGNWYAHPNEPERAGAGQLCYTAHGNKEDYERMVEAVAERIVSELDSHPDMSVITFTQEDGNPPCDCPACRENVKKYGGAYSANVILFLNAVDERVFRVYSERAKTERTPVRRYKILFFAYTFNLLPPAQKRRGGRYSAIAPEVVCRENVGVYVAPIFANYYRSLRDGSDPANEEIAEQMRAWGACSKSIYFWLYETNFSHYLYPFNTFDGMPDSYRFCRELSGEFLFNEGQINNGAVTGFGRLKEYFNSVSSFNVNCELKQIEDEFFKGYFREAAEPMRAMYEGIKARCYFNERENPRPTELFLDFYKQYLSDSAPPIRNAFLKVLKRSRVLERDNMLYSGGGIYSDITQIRYWPKPLLEEWLGYIERAYAAVESYRERDPKLHRILTEHICLESIFPRYALLSLYGNAYQKDELAHLKGEFRTDCEALGVTRLNETTLIQTVWAEWHI